MGYGLRLRDAVGTIILDIVDRITRFRFSTEVASGVSSNTTLSDISGLDSVEFSISLSLVYNAVQHDVVRSGTTLTWTAKSGTNYVSANSLIFQFLYT